MIFIDSGAFIAQSVSADQNHRAATRTWERFRTSSTRLFTSDAVLAETLNFLARRVNPRFAAQRGRELFGSNRLAILRSNAAAESAAFDQLEKFSDLGVSFVDALSAVLMKNNRLRQTFTYDKHFTMMGFEIYR